MRRSNRNAVPTPVRRSIMRYSNSTDRYRRGYKGRCKVRPQLVVETLEDRCLLSADLTATLVANSPPAVDASARPVSATIIPGELLVSFKPGVTKAEIGRFYRDYDLSEKEALGRFAQGNPGRLKVVSVPPAQTEAYVSILDHDPRVAYAEPNYLMAGALQAITPTDSDYIQQYANDNV